MDWLNASAALVTILSFGFGVWQWRHAQRVVRTDREAIAEYRERLRNAQNGARLAWELANEVVQRTKEASASKEDLRSGARSVRAAVGVLQNQLSAQERLLATVDGRPATQGALYSPPPAVRPPVAGATAVYGAPPESTFRSAPPMMPESTLRSPPPG